MCFILGPEGLHSETSTQMTTQYTASSAGNRMMAIGLQHKTYVTFSFFLAYKGKKYTFQTIKEKL